MHRPLPERGAPASSAGTAVLAFFFGGGGWGIDEFLLFLAKLLFTLTDICFVLHGTIQPPYTQYVSTSKVGWLSRNVSQVFRRPDHIFNSDSSSVESIHPDTFQKNNSGESQAILALIRNLADDFLSEMNGNDSIK